MRGEKPGKALSNAAGNPHQEKLLEPPGKRDALKKEMRHTGRKGGRMQNKTRQQTLPVRSHRPKRSRQPGEENKRRVSHSVFGRCKLKKAPRQTKTGRMCPS